MIPQARLINYASNFLESEYCQRSAIGMTTW